jgi:hypothetical protein
MCDRYSCDQYLVPLRMCRHRVWRTRLFTPFLGDTVEEGADLSLDVVLQEALEARWEAC